MGTLNNDDDDDDVAGFTANEQLTLSKLENRQYLIVLCIRRLFSLHSGDRSHLGCRERGREISGNNCDGSRAQQNINLQNTSITYSKEMYFQLMGPEVQTNELIDIRSGLALGLVQSDVPQPHSTQAQSVVFDWSSI